MVLCFFVVGLPVVSARAASERDIENRMGRLENEIQTLSRAIYKGETPPPGAFAGGGDVADLNVRIDQLETQIRDLTGKLEEISYQNNQLKEQMERMASDNDMRFNNISSAQTPPNRPVYVAPQPTPAGEGTSYPDQPAPAAGGGYQWGTDNVSDSGASSGSVIAPSDAGSAAYENAFAMLKSQQYDAAEQGFLSFIAQNPNHALTGNAKYWLGESYYARSQYDKAARTFAEAYQQYPQSPKAPDNLLKLGLSLAGQGKKDDACVALAQIEKDFAATAGPVLERAKTEMANFGC